MSRTGDMTDLYHNALAEIARLRAENGELNALLREVGWGQGEIDSSATIAEENERLRGERFRLMELVHGLMNDLQSISEYATYWKSRLAQETGDGK